MIILQKYRFLKINLTCSQVAKCDYILYVIVKCKHIHFLLVKYNFKRSQDTSYRGKLGSCYSITNGPMHFYAYSLVSVYCFLTVIF